MTETQIEWFSQQFSAILVTFAFDPNDNDTRQNVHNAFFNFLSEQPEVYDFAVVCNETNNAGDRPTKLRADICLKVEEDGPFFYFPLTLDLVETTDVVA